MDVDVPDGDADVDDTDSYLILKNTPSMKILKKIPLGYMRSLVVSLKSV